ncbi:L,D-transpeptidase [Coraliomargarita algicola]|uniref:L,D-transpeptidase n=3 Tax=Coraliomargaritaceae TaxID=3056371 RepID=A0ABZ0RSD6_9BACT|nr:L,D-transpeptidase [Coraliomargarita sp. J2-16]WPJ97986.1 L,D-transpeptidase [Coraliomargarita sp. J2-16]
MPFDLIEESARVKQSCEALSITPTDRCLLVSIADQTMVVLENSKLVKEYTVSTSKNPPSCVADSFGTPSGLHTIADKIGADAPEGMVFKGRVATGELYTEVSEEDAARSLITSRILRMRGLEPGKNSGPGCDTYDRYVYIHGTNKEELIGQPASAGCVQLRNREMIELFERVEAGDLVWIR